MFKFWRKKTVEAVQSSIAERIEPRVGIFGAGDDEKPFTRAQLVHQTMMAIRDHAIAMMPKVDGSHPDMAMDGLDVEGGTFSAYANPNLSEGLVLWYAQQAFIGHQMCALIATHWLVNKACSQMPRDAMRKGYKIISDDGNELDPKDAKFIDRYDRAFNIKKHAIQFVRKGRIFGIRIALFKVDSPDPYYYEKPFNIDGVMPGAYKGIVQIDPYWCAPLLDAQASSNPVSMHFYEPTYWLINGKKYHRSHLAIYINDEVVDFLKPSYIYGGVPLPQQIMERVYAAERTANEGPMLAMTKRQTVLKVDAAQVLANKQQFDETMSWWTATRDNYQVRVVDKDNEDVVQIDTMLNDLDKVIMNQYQLVCAIARTPAPKMLGTVPTGFNSTGDYEEASYHEECESTQDDMRPLIDRHHQLVCRSHLRKRIRVKVEFPPMDAPKESERADTFLKKMQAAKLAFEMGAVDGVDVNEYLRMDPTLGFTSITPAMRPTDAEDIDVDDEGKPVRIIEDQPAPSEMFGATSSGESANDPRDSGAAFED